MNEEPMQLGDGILSQIEQAEEAHTEPNLSSTIEHLIDELDGINYVPEREENNEDSSLSGGIVDRINTEALEALASGNATVEQVLGIEQPEELPLLNEGETQESIHREIPVNSDSLLVGETTARFSSAIWYEEIQKKTIILAGVGGIGSYVGFLLSRMRPSGLFIYDPDRVESVNMSGQLYGKEDIGMYKTEALARMIDNYSNFRGVFTDNGRFTESNEGTDIMICGFDNMEARKTFFNKWIEHVNKKSTDEEKGKCLYIDGRLAAEEFQVLCIRGNDSYNINRYNNEFLFSDDEADETICSYKQTSFMACMIASVMVNLFVNFVTNQCNPLIDRDLPFYTSYNAETMYYKTES